MPAIEPPVEYSPIIRRAPIRWPNNARVAFWVIPNIEYFRYDLQSPAALNPVSALWVPDTINYSWRDYGVRIGVWRMMDVLDKHRIRATVALNSEVCRTYPVIVEESAKRQWEFMAHGITNSIRMVGLTPDEQRQTIRESLDVIEASTGQRPQGWLGPGLAQTYETLEVLAGEGLRYVGDWVNDDQPYRFTVPSGPNGPLLSMPYSLEINDILIFVYSYQSGPEFLQIVKDQFDTLYAEGAKTGRVMGLAVHPYIVGTPQRIKYFDEALSYIRSHADVWFATGSEIADSYLRQTGASTAAAGGTKTQTSSGTT
jgi:peptidoglycan/xylan/chitin deacetylase (PgdA/CDA1 family)